MRPAKALFPLALLAASPAAAHIFDIEWIKAHSNDFGSLPPLLFAYIKLGIEHILTGYDHMLFLLALVLFGRTLGGNVKIISSFTVAHSITLACAALGVINLPSVLVEPAIAASIVYVAVENYFLKSDASRWRITFLFGLVHGFGFAGVLRETGFPQDKMLAALVAFNVGVEIGQLLIILVAYWVVSRLRETQKYPLVARFGNAGIACMGSFWFVSRVWSGIHLR